MSSKVAFVMGGANTLADDYANGIVLCEPDVMVFTNNIGRDWRGQVEHYVTLHPEHMQGWLDERAAKGYRSPDNLWTSNKKNLPKGLKWNHVESWDGSSGLLAVTVALHLGYDKVILCGVPLDKSAAHYDDPTPWPDGPRYRHAWIKHLPEMRGKVKSMSGWTQKLLGATTREWLND